MGNCFSGIIYLLQQSVKQKAARLVDKKVHTSDKPQSLAIRVRHLSPVDCASMIELEMACFPQIASNQPGIHFVTQLDYFTLGAFVDGQLVGAVTTQQRWREKKQPSREENRRVLRNYLRPSYIANLAVLGCGQEKGIATTLLKLIIDREREKRADAIYLHVVATNRKALRLYEKLGFVRSGFIEDFYGQQKGKVSTDAIVCVRSL